MEKYAKIALIIILSVTVFLALTLTGTLKLFYTVSPSGAITVLSEGDYKPVAGAIVTIDATNNTFHLLGDVSDPYMNPVMDGKINDYDVIRMTDAVSRPYDSWYDLNKDGIVNLRDQTIVNLDSGLIWHESPIKYTSVTDTNGKVYPNVVQTNIENAYSYLASVSLSGVIKDKSNVLVDVRSSTNTIVVTKLKPPNALFTFSPQNPTPGQTITFDASASYDPDGTISKYEWDFDNNGVVDKTGVTTTWSYSASGSYPVTLKVTDNDGLTGTQTQTVTVSTPPPVASFTWSPTTPKVGQTVTFDASASTGDSITYSWNFGDGSSGTGVKPTHTYSNYGSYSVSLTVTDSSSRTNTCTKSITVIADPTADFSWSPTTPYVNTQVQFTDKSTPNGGTITSWSWNFGDGHTSTLQNPTNTYANAGIYSVTLTVTDSEGLTNSKTQSITVIDASSPSVDFTWSPNPPYVSESVLFTATASPGSGSITGYAWYINGVQQSSTSNTMTTSFGSATSYTVSCKVTNSYGKSTTATKTVSVINYPVADFTFSPTNPVVGDKVTFTSTSTGSISSYDWSFGDGATGSGGSVSHSYTTAGTYTVTLTIKDVRGTTKSASKPITISRPQVVASFSYSPTNPREGDTVHFDASASSGDITSWTWNFGDGGTGSGKLVDHVFNLAGSYNVSLTVSDGYSSNTAYQTVNVQALTPPVINVLTLLEFPPSTQVDIKIYVTRDASPLSGATVTLNIPAVPEANYGGTTKSSSTGSDGIAIITIISPPTSLYSPYKMTISCLSVSNTYDLKVLPQILVKTTQFNYEQTYKPGDYDFIYSGQTVDKESGVIVSDCALAAKELKDEAGNVIAATYTYYDASGGAFTFKAKVYDYYASINPNFNYEIKTLTLTLTFAKTGYIKGTLNVTAKIGPPSIVAVIGSTSITVGTNSFKVAFKDKQGQPYTGLTASNIEVIITTPSGTTMSTSRELSSKYYFDDSTKTITVSYDFTELGTYKITVNYFGLPFTQASQTFSVSCVQASVIPPILTNPYVLGFIGLIILILLLRRRKK